MQPSKFGKQIEQTFFTSNVLWLYSLKCTTMSAFTSKANQTFKKTYAEEIFYATVVSSLRMAYLGIIIDSIIGSLHR